METVKREELMVATSSGLELPVGFRFKPTDEELVRYYLMNRAYFKDVPDVDAIKEIDATRFYDNHPSNLVTSSTGEREWFFFIYVEDDENYSDNCCSHAHARRNVREVGNGLGFWKREGSENLICTTDENGSVSATKIFLTFYTGSCHSSNKSKKSHWKMVEYHLQIKKERVVLGKLQRGVPYTEFNFEDV